MTANLIANTAERFFNLYSHGFARVAVGVPQCRVADPAFNAQQTLALARQAAQQGAVLVAFPELGLSAYTCEDLFRQQTLLDACERALASIVAASASLPLALVVGLPVRAGHTLFNCAAVVAQGRILGVVPKTYLPNYGEFYEARQFGSAEVANAIGAANTANTANAANAVGAANAANAANAINTANAINAANATNAAHTAGATRTVRLAGQDAPFGAALVFDVPAVPFLRFHVEICEDLWVPVPPSSFAALAGATVLVNLSASNVVVGKAHYRHQLVSQQSARCLAAYLYTSAGNGESSTDLAWDGQALICENGELLAQSARFLDASHLVCADIDVERLSQERVRQTTFGDSIRRHAGEVAKFRALDCPVAPPSACTLPLARRVERFPYVPADARQRDERCHEVYHIQVQALAQRLAASGMKKVVIGVSGGLDSTHALLVCAKAMDRLGLPRTNILAYTMPGFATSERTLRQARQLMAVTGCTAAEIDIRPACRQMLADLGHPYARGEAAYDITFENVQAGERTNHLFRLANFHQAIVIGTGDLSELALGWCTYGVGDHMSHYSVNASVPKTLITHLVRWVAETGQIGHSGTDVLAAVLDTDISPELIPGHANNAPGQKTERAIGPYELQDFNLYYTLRFGFTPSKVAFLALAAWHDSTAGDWPEGAHVARNAYDLAAIKHNLAIFLERFFRTSQFKRSCIPNAPKVGSGGSLSPRGDWRAPSDAEATVWLDDLARVPDR